jgi:hypothetical protein
MVSFKSIGKGVAKGADAVGKGVAKGAGAAGKGVAKGAGAAGKGVVKGAGAAGGFMKNKVLGPVWNFVKSIAFYLYCVCCLCCCCSLWSTGIVQAVVGRVSKAGETWSTTSISTSM